MPRRNPRADPFDKIIGANIRRYRMAAGLSQAALADTLGISYQQIGKYEAAVDRVAASRLLRIAQTLNTPISEFWATDSALNGNHPFNRCSQSTEAAT